MVRRAQLQLSPWGITSDPEHRQYLEHIRRTPGPFTDPDATSEEFLSQFDKVKIL